MSQVSAKHVLKAFTGNKASISGPCFDWWWNRWGMRHGLSLRLSAWSPPSQRMRCFHFGKETSPNSDMRPAFDRQPWQRVSFAPLNPDSAHFSNWQREPPGVDHSYKTYALMKYDEWYEQNGETTRDYRQIFRHLSVLQRCFVTANCSKVTIIVKMYVKLPAADDWLYSIYMILLLLISALGKSWRWAWCDHTVHMIYGNLVDWGEIVPYDCSFLLTAWLHATTV